MIRRVRSPLPRSLPVTRTAPAGPTSRRALGKTPAPRPVRRHRPTTPMTNRPETNVKYRDLLKMVEADGSVLVTTKGSQRQYKHPAKKGRVTIVAKPSKDVPGVTDFSGTGMVHKNGVQ